MTAPTDVAILVGDPLEPHLAAVLFALEQGPDNYRIGGRNAAIVVLDAASAGDVVLEMTPSQTVLRGTRGELVTLESARNVYGWIRRIAPAGWDVGVNLGSHQAAVLSARLTLLSAVLCHPSISWLTSAAQNVESENKLIQYRIAHALGIRIPSTIVGPGPEALVRRLGDPFVLKPLGPASYAAADGVQHSVYANLATCDSGRDNLTTSGAPSHRATDVSTLSEGDFRRAPFIAQSYVKAMVHIRVVTVGDKSWLSTLDATRLPLDWRAAEHAHTSFEVSHNYAEVANAASRLARTMGCRYTSQDWIVDQGGATFIDLNPGGQWLFLPEPVASQITKSLADYLLPVVHN